MSLSCEINVTNPNDGIFRPGGSIYGIIKYQIYDPTQFSRITISLKGKGVLDIAGSYKRKCFENYVDIDQVIQQGDINLDIGIYEAPFCFQLPSNIPPSFECCETCQRYKVKNCRIFYYIRIKFDKLLKFQSGKRFKKDIIVGLHLRPRLDRQPATSKKCKSLFQEVSGSQGSVYVTALIESSVLSPGEKIKITYTVHNESDLMLNGVITKLVEVLTFRPYRPLLKTKCYKNVNGTTSRTSIIYPRETFTRLAEIVIPQDCTGTLEYSSLVVKHYSVHIVVDTPYPQSDVILKIPVRIVNFETNSSSSASSSSSTPRLDRDAPPSYWETMGDDAFDGDSDNNSGSDSNQ